MCLTNCCILVSMSSISVKTNLVENYMHIQAIRVPFLLSFLMTRDAKVAQGFIFLCFYNLSVDIWYDSFEKGSGGRRIQRMCRYSLMPRTEFEVRLSVSGRHNIVQSLGRVVTLTGYRRLLIVFNEILKFEVLTNKRLWFGRRNIHEYTEPYHRIKYFDAIFDRHFFLRS
jgi:hypothetical protein